MRRRYVTVHPSSGTPMQPKMRGPLTPLGLMHYETIRCPSLHKDFFRS